MTSNDTNITQPTSETLCLGNYFEQLIEYLELQLYLNQEQLAWVKETNPNDKDCLEFCEDQIADNEELLAATRQAMFLIVGKDDSEKQLH